MARVLIGMGGKQKFVQYVGYGMQTENWNLATQKYYGFESLGELQQTWLSWVRRGSPMRPVDQEPDGVKIASADTTEKVSEEPIFRAQNSSSVPLGERLGLGRARQAAGDRLAALTPRPTQKSPSSSWYVRQNAKAKKNAQRPDPSQSRGSAYASKSRRAAATRSKQNQSSAQRPVRGQPLQQRRVILEWSHPDRQPPQDSVRPPIRYDAPIRRPDTIWR